MPEKVMRALRRGSCCLVLAAALFGAVTASAQEEEKVVRLRDGTVLRGTLVPSAEGVFRVRTRALGEIQVDPAEIVSVEGPDGAAGAEVRPAQMERMKSEMVNNPQVMEAIEELSHDEEVIALMQDEQLQAAIMSLDLDYLRQDDRFQAFTEHPGVQAIVNKVRATGATDE